MSTCIPEQSVVHGKVQIRTQTTVTPGKAPLACVVK